MYLVIIFSWFDFVWSDLVCFFQDFFCLVFFVVFFVDDWFFGCLWFFGVFFCSLFHGCVFVLFCCCCFLCLFLLLVCGFVCGFVIYKKFPVEMGGYLTPVWDHFRTLYIENETDSHVIDFGCVLTKCNRFQESKFACSCSINNKQSPRNQCCFFHVKIGHKG